jgi:hypothetical protein
MRLLSLTAAKRHGTIQNKIVVKIIDREIISAYYPLYNAVGKRTLLDEQARGD